MQNDKPTFITTSDLAKLCGVSRFTIINWVNEGKIKAIRTIGGHSRVPISEVISVLEKQHIEREKKNQPESIPSYCWEYTEKKDCEKKCGNCLIFNRKIDYCFMLVKQFGGENILCKGNCMECGYFQDFFKEKSGETEIPRERDDEAASHEKKRLFLHNFSYDIGANLSKLMHKLKKKQKAFKKETDDSKQR